MKPSLFEIFKLYFIIGLQLIGGGYVIYPLLKKYLIEDKNLLTEDELTDYLAISQCLPGIIALNVSIFSGYKLRKIKGAIIAVLGLLLPAFLIILLLANIILTYQENQIVKYFMFGVRLSIIVLITSMLYDIFKKELEQYPDIKIEIVHKGILILRFMYKDAALFDIFPYDSYHKETLSEKEKANLFKESKKCFKKIRQNWLNNKTKDNLPLFLDNIRLNVDKHILNNNKRTGDIFFVGCEGLGDKMFFFKKQDIFPLKKALFEEVEFNVPANYHKILSEIYGDYMSLPDISKFQINHMGAFNTNNDNVYQDKNLGEITALMTDIIKKIKENQA